MDAPTSFTTRFELRFDSLFKSGRGYSFACDLDGKVDLDSLTSKSRANYFYARMMIGHDFSTPRIIAIDAGDMS